MHECGGCAVACRRTDGGVAVMMGGPGCFCPEWPSSFESFNIDWVIQLYFESFNHILNLSIYLDHSLYDWMIQYILNDSIVLWMIQYIEWYNILNHSIIELFCKFWIIWYMFGWFKLECSNILNDILYWMIQYIVQLNIFIQNMFEWLKISNDPIYIK